MSVSRETFFIFRFKTYGCCGKVSPSFEQVDTIGITDVRRGMYDSLESVSLGGILWLK